MSVSWSNGFQSIFLLKFSIESLILDTLKIKGLTVSCREYQAPYNSLYKT